MLFIWVHYSSPALAGQVTTLTRQPFPLLSHTAIASYTTRFPIISGFPFTFGQRDRPLPFFSMWKEERFLYVYHFQKPRSLFMKPVASTSPSETASGLLINYNPPPAVICSVFGIFRVYSNFTNVSWQDNRQCHIKSDVIAVLVGGRICQCNVTSRPVSSLF